MLLFLAELREPSLERIPRKVRRGAFRPVCPIPEFVVFGVGQAHINLAELHV